MDPNATLTRIRDLVHYLRVDDTDRDVAADLTDAVEALDRWITRGGFLPAAWSAASNTDADITVDESTGLDAAESIADTAVKSADFGSMPEDDPRYVITLTEVSETTVTRPVLLATAPERYLSPLPADMVITHPHNEVAAP